MKICPKCFLTYPDDANYCRTDRSPLQVMPATDLKQSAVDSNTTTSRSADSNCPTECIDTWETPAKSSSNPQSSEQTPAGKYPLTPKPIQEEVLLVDQRYPIAAIPVQQIRPATPTTLASPDEGTQQQLIGFALPYLPDFLEDHTLLSQDDEERLREHCKRWTYFIASLWRECPVVYALMYRWNPPMATDDDTVNLPCGQIMIYLLAKVATVYEREEVAEVITRGLKTVGIDATRLEADALNRLVTVNGRHGFEIRQRDERITVNSRLIQQMYYDEMVDEYGKDLAERYITNLRNKGVYSVMPWWGPGGSHLGPFHAMVEQPSALTMIIFLRSCTLNEVSTERAWLMEWGRLLAKWGDDSGSKGESISFSRSIAQSDSTAKSTSEAISDGLSGGKVKGHSRQSGFFGNLTVTVSDQEGWSHVKNTTEGSTVSKGITDTDSVSITKGSVSYTRKDPLARWMADEMAAQFRRLYNPFCSSAYVISDNVVAARSVAHALASSINEEVPFESPLGDEKQHRSAATVVRLQEQRVAMLQQMCVTLDYHPKAVQTSGILEAEDPHMLNYLLDARGAATAFRLPVSMNGGIPGIPVKQLPPAVHPGRIYHDATPKDHINLGVYHAGGKAIVPVKELTKHMLVTGFTGSGKTTTVLNLLHQLWEDHGIPFLVIESAKKEYRGLLGIDLFQQGKDNNPDTALLIYTLGNETVAPFRLNPFEILPGIRVETHISRLQLCFEGALPAMPFLPAVLAEALVKVYRQKDWMLTDSGPDDLATDGREFPVMDDFIGALEAVIADAKYAGEVQSNVRAATILRIKRLLSGSLRFMFDTQRSIDFGKLFSQPSILELNDLNLDDKALVMMFMLMFLREFREEHNAKQLLHITVVEEAHNVLGQTEHQNTEVAADTRAKSVEAFCTLLAEVRALGEGLVIADQSPNKLAPDAMRNTNVQIAHQLRESHDREAVANAMIMSEEQQDFLGKLEPGQAAVFFTGLQRATFIQAEHYTVERGKAFRHEDQVTDVEVRRHMDVKSNVASYRTVDTPLASCAACGSRKNCPHRAMVRPLLKQDAVWDTFRQLCELASQYMLFDTGQEDQRQELLPMLREELAIFLNAATLHLPDQSADARWCLVTHLWSRKGLSQKLLKTLNRTCWDTLTSNVEANAYSPIG